MTLWAKNKDRETCACLHCDNFFPIHSYVFIYVSCKGVVGHP